MFYFLVSSLPSLKLGEKAPLTVTEFDELCMPQMSGADFARLQRGTILPGKGKIEETLPAAYREFLKFEQYLRTFLARKRLSGAEAETAGLPEQNEILTYADAALQQASGMKTAEREAELDRIRWTKLDEFNPDEFSFDALCIYRLKLQILNKYTPRTPENGRCNFDAAVNGISK